jgi:hypothetical protein
VIGGRLVTQQASRWAALGNFASNFAQWVPRYVAHAFDTVATLHAFGQVGAGAGWLAGYGLGAFVGLAQSFAKAGQQIGSEMGVFIVPLRSQGALGRQIAARERTEGLGRSSETIIRTVQEQLGKMPEKGIDRSMRESLAAGLLEWASIARELGWGKSAGNRILDLTQQFLNRAGSEITPAEMRMVKNTLVDLQTLGVGMGLLGPVAAQLEGRLNNALDALESRSQTRLQDAVASNKEEEYQQAGADAGRGAHNLADTAEGLRALRGNNASVSENFSANAYRRIGSIFSSSKPVQDADAQQSRARAPSDAQAAEQKQSC